MNSKKLMLVLMLVICAAAVLLALAFYFMGFELWFIYQLLKIGFCVTAFFACIVHTLRRQGRRKGCTKSVTAYIDDVRSNGSGKYAPTYIFTVNDEQIRVKSDLYTFYSASRGECEILIDPNAPKRIFEPKRERENALAYIAAAIAAVIGIFIVIRFYLLY